MAAQVAEEKKIAFCYQARDSTLRSVEARRVSVERGGIGGGVEYADTVVYEHSVVVKSSSDFAVCSACTVTVNFYFGVR